MGIFHNENKNIKKTLLNEDARKAAELFTKPGKDKRGRPQKAITKAQLRRFFGDCKANQKRVENASDFNAVLPLIKMTIPKVEYAKGRGLVPEEFSDWLKTNIDAIDNETDFEAFRLHFEAVIGFCYGLGIKD